MLQCLKLCKVSAAVFHAFDDIRVRLASQVVLEMPEHILGTHAQPSPHPVQRQMATHCLSVRCQHISTSGMVCLPSPTSILFTELCLNKTWESLNILHQPFPAEQEGYSTQHQDMAEH